MIYIVSGVVVFLIFVILSRLQNEKGLKLLSNEEKGSIVSAYSKTRMVSTLILSGIVVGFLLVAFYLEVDKITAMIVYFAAIFLFYVISGIISLIRIQKMNLPSAYFRYARNATILRTIGLSGFIVLIGIGLYQEFLKQMIQSG